MAKATQSSLQQVLDRAIENERRRLLLDDANRAYLRLRQEPKAWRAWQTELRAFDATLGDGIGPK